MSITKEYHDLRVYGEITSTGLTIQRPIGAANGYRFPNADGTANQILATNGAGQLVFQNATSLALTTDDVPEGLINLYFTNERVDDRVAALIQNGLGINWTYDDVANTFTGNVTLAPFTTDDLTEGTTNLYFTNEKVDDRVAQLIIDGTGLTWTYDDVANTLQGVVSLSPFTTDNLTEGTTNLYFTDEAAQDAAAAMIQNGTGISWSYNDLGNTLTPTITLSPFNTDDLTEGTTNLYFTNEKVDDRVAALVQDTPTVTWTYNDVANTLKADATSRVKIQKNGALVGDRDTINFIEGADIHLSVADDSVNGKVNVTVSYNGTPGSGGVSVAASEGLSSDIGTVELGDEVGGGQAFFTTDREINLNGKYLEFLGTAQMDFIISGRGGGGIGVGSLFENDLSSMFHLHGVSTSSPDNLMLKNTMLLSSASESQHPVKSYHANLDTDGLGTHITINEDYVLNPCQVIGENRYDGYIRGVNGLGSGSPLTSAIGISTLSSNLKLPLSNTYAVHTNTLEGETPTLWPGFNEEPFFPISLDGLKNSSSNETFKKEYDDFKVFNYEIKNGGESYDIPTEFAKNLASSAKVSEKTTEVSSKLSESKSEYNEISYLAQAEIAGLTKQISEATDLLDDYNTEKGELEEKITKLNAEITEVQATKAEKESELATLNSDREAAVSAYNTQNTKYTDLIAQLDSLLEQYNLSSVETLADLEGSISGVVNSLLYEITEAVDGESYEESWATLLKILSDGSTTLVDAINKVQDFKTEITQLKANADKLEAAASKSYTAEKEKLEEEINEATKSLTELQEELAKLNATLVDLVDNISKKEAEKIALESSLASQTSNKESADAGSKEMESKSESWDGLKKELIDLSQDEDGLIDCLNVSYSEYYIGGTPYCLDDPENIKGIELNREYSKFGQGWLYGADIEVDQKVNYGLGHSNASLVIGTTNIKDGDKCELPTAMLDVYGNSFSDTGKYTDYPFVRFRGLPLMSGSVSNVYVDKSGYLWQTKGGGILPMNGLAKKMTEFTVNDEGIQSNLLTHFKFDSTPRVLSNRESLSGENEQDITLYTNNGYNSIDGNFAQMEQSLRIGGQSVFRDDINSSILPFGGSISARVFFDDVNTGTQQIVAAISDANDGVVIYENEGKIYAGIYDDGAGINKQAICEAPISKETWYHVALCWDTAIGNQKVNLYLNGTQVSTIDISGMTSLTDGINIADNTLMVGGQGGAIKLPFGTGTYISPNDWTGSAPATYSFAGYIEDLRIYNGVALSADEVTILSTIIDSQSSVRLGGDLVEATDINLDTYNFKFKSISQNTNYLNIGSYVTDENRKAAQDLQKELDATIKAHNKQKLKIQSEITNFQKTIDDSSSTLEQKDEAQTGLTKAQTELDTVISDHNKIKTDIESRIAEQNAGEPIWEIGCAENELLNKPEDTMLSANGKISATNNIQIRIGTPSESYESTFSSTNFTPEGLFYTLRNSRDNTGTGVKFQVGDYVTNEWLTDGRAILINTSATQGETFYNSSHYAKHNSIHIGNETTGQTGGANYGGTGQIKSEYFSWNVTTPTSPTNVDLYTNPDTQEEIQISPAKNTGHFFFESIVMGMGECEANSVTIKLKGSARVDAGANAALIGSVTKTVESTNGVAGTTTADASVGSGKLRIRVTGEADDIMMWNANTIVHGMTWTKNTIEPDACGEAATQYVYKKCAISEENDSCGDGSLQITTLGLVGGYNKFRLGCCWYVLDVGADKDETFTEIDVDRITPHTTGALSCDTIANLYATEWENCVTKEKRVSLCCNQEGNYPADVVISNLLDASGNPLLGCWKKLGYADSTGTITARCPEEFNVPNRACLDDDCQPPTGFSYFLCEGQEECEIPNFKVDKQIVGVEEGTEKIRFQCCWYEYRQLEASSNSVTIPGHVPVHAGTCADAIKINGIKWKKCGSEEIRFSECCESESQYNLGDVIDNLRDAGCKSTLPGCWEYQGKAQLDEESVDTACCPDGAWNVVGTGSECPESCTDTSTYFILEQCQTEAEKKAKAPVTTIQAGAQTGYTGNGSETVIYNGTCYTVKTGGESGNDSLALTDFTIGDCDCCVNRDCVVATKYVDCESTSEEITLLTCGELSPGSWINISGECYNISDKTADPNNCVTYTYTIVENCQVCARGGVDIKIKQDAEDKKKYEVELKSKDREIALRRFELDAEPASGAKITAAALKGEVFNSETWTSTVISEDGLRSPENSDWTASDAEGYPNPATLSVEDFISAADLIFDTEVDLIAEDIKNQQWTRSDGSIIPDKDVTVTIELASGKK